MLENEVNYGEEIQGYDEDEDEMQRDAVATEHADPVVTITFYVKHRVMSSPFFSYRYLFLLLLFFLLFLLLLLLLVFFSLGIVLWHKPRF